MSIPDKIRVAYVIGGLPFGGVENWLYDLGLAFQDDPDVEAHIINVSGTGRKTREFFDAGLHVVCTSDSKKVLKTQRLSTASNVRKELVRIRPHIVHTLQFSGDYFGRLAAWGLGVPVITHIRNVKSERKLHRRLINKLLSFRTDLYLSVSKAALETIRREHNLARRPMQVLYNAVDPDKLDVPAHDLQALFGLDGPVILGVGRLVAQKNFDKLLRAFALVLKDIPDAGLVILGDGPLRDDLEQLKSQLGLDGRAVLAGYRPNSEVPRFLRAATLLAMPSDYEGLPVTHVEAMFCGLPAVISEHVPSIEIASECSLVCTTEPESIAARLVELLSNPSRCTEMSVSAKRLAEKYTMTRYVARLKDVYRNLLGEGS
jgi:glycosyltransferase involved in cell wall biosynthesis